MDNCQVVLSVLDSESVFTEIYWTNAASQRHLPAMIHADGGRQFLRVEAIFVYSYMYLDPKGPPPQKGLGSWQQPQWDVGGHLNPLYFF